MTGTCHFCHSHICESDYTSVPAHVSCVANLPPRTMSPKQLASNTFLDGCKICGKSNTLSPRQERKRGCLQTVCRQCDKISG